ncbi:MAG: hypothetical protein RLZZ450_125 [Pseudomonadota bacterium]
MLELLFKPMYSAYVEGHEATLPVTFRYPPFRKKGATFSSSDPTIATVVDTPEGALITVKRAGTVVIRAALEGDTGSAKLIINGFTEAQWKIGEARYLGREPAVVAPDGGVVTVLRIAEPNARNPDGSCMTCHSADAPLLKVEDTPAQTAGYSDQELITIFTMGALPTWVEKATQPVQFIWGANHAWTVTEEEQQGLLAYLRTKAPKAVLRGTNRSDEPLALEQKNDRGGLFVRGPLLLGVPERVRVVACIEAVAKAHRHTQRAVLAGVFDARRTLEHQRREVQPAPHAWVEVGQRRLLGDLCEREPRRLRTPQQRLGDHVAKGVELGEAVGAAFACGRVVGRDRRADGDQLGSQRQQRVVVDGGTGTGLSGHGSEGIEERRQARIECGDDGGVCLVDRRRVYLADRTVWSADCAIPARERNGRVVLRARSEQQHKKSNGGAQAMARAPTRVGPHLSSCLPRLP